MVTGKVEIQIIQGDSYQKNVLISKVDLALIEGVYFSCSKLNIEKKLDYDRDIERYVFALTSNETKDLPPIYTDYDITVKFNDDKIKTVSYRGSFSVLLKTNKVGGIDDE